VRTQRARWYGKRCSRRHGPSLGVANHLAPSYACRPLGRKRDIKQFRQACAQVGLSVEERYEASRALHAEKKSSDQPVHMGYADLVEWLREWRKL